MNFFATEIFVAQRQQDLLREAQQERRAFLARQTVPPVPRTTVSMPSPASSIPCATC